MFRYENYSFISTSFTVYEVKFSLLITNFNYISSIYNRIPCITHRISTNRLSFAKKGPTIIPDVLLMLSE